MKSLFLWLLIALSNFCSLTIKTSIRSGSRSARVEDNCIIAGCNSEICKLKGHALNMEGCVNKPEYACYRGAKCIYHPRNHTCSWKQTQNLNACLYRDYSSMREFILNPDEDPIVDLASDTEANPIRVENVGNISSNIVQPTSFSDFSPQTNPVG